MIRRMHAMVERFTKDLLAIPIPDQPQLLPRQRAQFRIDHLNEELREIKDATNEQDLEGVTDGLIDLVYVALGNLIEMGIAPGPIFEEVHLANMRKKRGNVAKRSGALGYDAIKPEGWTPPDLTPYLLVTRDDLEKIELCKGLDLYAGQTPTRTRVIDSLMSSEYRPPIPEIKAVPKVLVIGYMRHGKDTVCEMMRDLHGYRFTSSSAFCAQKIVFPALKNQYDYKTVGDCFRDRANHRKEWFDLITDFNTPYPTTLGRAIFAEHDVYCGLRRRTELNGLLNSGVVDFIVWVDRSDHLPPEPKDSCDVEPWMAHFTIDNNGSLEDLERNVNDLMEQFQCMK